MTEVVHIPPGMHVLNEKQCIPSRYCDLLCCCSRKIHPRRPADLSISTHAPNLYKCTKDIEGEGYEFQKKSIPFHDFPDYHFRENLDIHHLWPNNVQRQDAGIVCSFRRTLQLHGSLFFEVRYPM